MPRKSLNKFEIVNGDVHISREGWDGIAETTYREDYFDELCSVTWTKGKHNYLSNGKFGLLHRYIMKQWYGEEMLNEMSKKGWIVDHINNNSMDCRISNLEFLLSDYNKAKGFTLDKIRQRLLYNLTLNIYKDFSTGNYQLILICNDKMDLKCPDGNVIVPNVIYFLYKNDYKTILLDAEKILESYESNRFVDIGKLSFDDIKVKESINMQLTDKEKEEVLNKERCFIMRDGELYAIMGLPGLKLIETNYIEGWDK